ncbi:MAG: alpha/beta hydrolase [Rhodospirillaceae bacterium]|nr:alpha/beta hydrolase [Rhodospirillaceae bacterium]
MTPLNTPADTPTKKEGDTINVGIIILNLFLGAGLLYSVLVAAMFLMQRDFMYFPDQSKPDPSISVAPEMKVVNYKTFDGVELSSWYYPPRNETFPVIMHFHGNAGNIGSRASKARMLIDKGYGVLLAEYRGYGGNSGTPDEPNLMFDGKAAVDFLASQGVPTSRVVAYGESLGSGIVVSLAMDAAFDGKHFKAVVLEAPFSSAVDAGRAHYPFLPVGILMKDRFESTSRISAIRAPLLIVHGDKDEVIPINLGKKLFSAALPPKEAKWIPGAGHNNLYEFGAGDVVLEFLQKVSLGGE